MTLADFASLTLSRRVGPDRCMGHCPAHEDRSKSLSIREGAEGRVLLRCFAGCSTAAILAALSLTMRDLFPDTPMDPRAREKARREALQHNAAARKQAKAERRVGDIYRRLTRVVDALGSRLARLPDGAEGDALAEVFHRACRMHCEVETRLGNYGWVRVPLVKAGPPCSPFLEPNAEALEAGRVTTETQLLRYVSTGVAKPTSEQTTQGPRERAFFKECA